MVVEMIWICLTRFLRMLRQCRTVVVPARFGTALYEALRGPKRLAVVKAADHNDWFERLDERWWREATSFLLGESVLP